MSTLVEDLMRPVDGSAEGDGAPAATEVATTLTCPEGCGFTTTSKSGLGIHLSRRHGIAGGNGKRSRKQNARRRQPTPARPVRSARPRPPAPKPAAVARTFDQTAAARLVAPDLPRPTLMKLLLDWTEQGEYLATEIAKDRKAK